MPINHPGVSIVLKRTVWPHTMTFAGCSASDTRFGIAAVRSAAYKKGSSAAAVARPTTGFALSLSEKLLLDDFDGGQLLADLETLHRATIMVRWMTNYKRLSICHPRGPVKCTAVIRIPVTSAHCCHACFHGTSP